MSPIIRAYDATVESVNKDDMSLVARVNTASVDYYRTVISPGGVDLSNYNKLGRPVLWEHGKDSRRFTDPIGNALWIKNNGGQAPTEILAKPRFLKDDFSRQRFEWYRDGVLRGWSVNILPTEGTASPPTKEELRARPDWEKAQLIYRQSTLAEFSGTVCPGQPEALTSDRAAKLLDLVQRSLLWLPDDVRPIIEAKACTMTESGGLASGGAAVQQERYIRKKDGKWIVYSESGKELGSHDSEEDAKKQLAAIEAHKHAKDERSVEWDGHAWAIIEPDGRTSAAFADETLARQCLELMQAAPTFEMDRLRLQGEFCAHQDRSAADRLALLDLMINGRV